MASSRVQTQVTWSSASSVTVNSASIVWSDPVALNVEDWDGDLQVYADNQGTPASGDVCDVYIAYSTGDILGDSCDDFATAEHAEFVMRLDTYPTNIPGEDPASRVVPMRTTTSSCKIGVSCPQAATRNIVVRA